MAAAHFDFNTSNGNSTQLERFLEIGKALRALFERSGIESLVTRSPLLPHFTALPPEDRACVLRMMSITLDCGLAMESLRESVARNRSLAWRVMTAMGFKPLSDVFELISESDIIEVYDSAGKVIFATPVYFDLTSYTMDDLYCRPWTELWGRDPKITELLMAKVGEVLDPSNQKTIVLDVPTHVVYETSSYERRTATVKPKLFSPVKDRLGQRGFISVNTLIALGEDRKL